MQITRAFSWSAAGASLALFGASLAAFLVAGAGEDGSQSRTTLTAPFDAAHGAALERRLGALGGTDCFPDRVELTSRSRYTSSARATARIECELDAAGTSTLSGLRFATEEDLLNLQQDQLNYLRGDGGRGGACSDVAGASPWYDGSGDERGWIYCYHGTVAWTDRPTRTAYVLTGQDGAMPTLIDWWERHVRAPVERRARYERELRRRFAPYLAGGTTGCERTQNPTVDAALKCGRKRLSESPGTMLDYVALYRAGTTRQLNALFENHEQEFDGPPSSNTRDEYCGSAPLVSRTWPADAPAKGQVFCFPSNGSQWLLWTTTRTKTAVMIGRQDQDGGALHDAWLELP